jgi:aminopeptidase-like protein
VRPPGPPDASRASGQRPPDGIAADLRRIADGFDPVAAGEERHALVHERYPICRNITGEGLRRSPRILQRIAPLELHEVPSGTAVFDWVVHREWNVTAARALAGAGLLSIAPGAGGA